jgi:hypothetical protein
MNKILIYIVLVFVGNTAIAQQKNSGVFNSPVMPGPNGVYIYAVDSAKTLRKTPRERVFMLYKEEKKGAGFKKIAELAFPVSSAELNKRLGPSLLQEILNNRKIHTAGDLYDLLTKRRFDTLGLYLMHADVRQAIGTLYIDQKVTGPDPGVSYRLVSVYNGNERVMYQHALSDIRYSKLAQFKNYQSTISDSIAMVTWYATGDHAAYATLFTSAGSKPENKMNAIGREYVYRRRDTMFVTYSVKTVPGSKLVM